MRNIESLHERVNEYFFLFLGETVASRRFMRGTDPKKSNWVYPKLIL
jgi:hypothetical protein